MLILLWAIFIVSVLGFTSVILAQLPQALQKPVGRTRVMAVADDLVTYLWRKLKIQAGKFWHFILEAKDLKPQIPTLPLNMNVDKVRKVFRIRVKEDQKDPDWMPEISETATVKDSSPEQLYLETIKRNPTDQGSYEGLGRLYLQEKNYAEAAETFRYLTRLNPNRDIYWSNLGLSLYSVKEYREAANAYDKALKINSKVPVRWINMALCFDAMDETGKAIKAITSALAFDNANSSYLGLLADLYLKAQNKVRAEEVLEQILHHDPGNKSAREKLMKLRI